MKNTVLFIYFLFSLPILIAGQSYDSSILFTAQKGGITYCGEMTTVSIVPSMTDPYKVANYLITIDDNLIAAQQTFVDQDIIYNESIFSSDYYESQMWCGTMNDYDDCYEIIYDSTSIIPIENGNINIHHFNAVSLIYGQDTFAIQSIENYGVIPFSELSILGYNDIEIAGIEIQDTFYPIVENGCIPSIGNESSSMEQIISSHTLNKNNSITYAYNNNGTLVTIQHADGCRLKIYESTEGVERLIFSDSMIYDFQINTDQFFEKNIIAGKYKNANEENHSFHIFENGNQYIAVTNLIDSSVLNISPLGKYSNLAFQQGKVEINDILGNRYSILNTTNQYSYGGSLLDKSFYAFYENNKKTIHLYDLDLELFQDLALIFPNIDGFKVVDGNFVTWRENHLSFFSFQTSTSYELDDNADINSISIHGDEMTWKSIDGSYFKKLSIDSNFDIIIEDQPLANESVNPIFCYWNDSTTIYANQQILEIENNEVIETSLFRSNLTTVLPRYDISLDSLNISLSVNTPYEYIFNFKVTNRGEYPINELKLSTTKQSDVDCPIPLLNYQVSLDSLETGASYSGSFSVNSDQFESMCFYISSPSGFSDSYFDDNYKCYSGDITNTTQLIEENILAYPNPAFDYLHIENYKGPITIFNATGKLVLNSEIDGSLNISNLPSGLYIMNFNNSEKVRFLKI